MKKLRLIRLGVLLAGSLLLPAGIAQAADIGVTFSTGPTIYADTAPPAPIVEVQPASPGSGYVWIGGNWVWGDNHRWTWEKGRWENPPRSGMHYVPHHYEERGGKHVFQRGGWKDK